MFTLEYTVPYTREGWGGGGGGETTGGCACGGKGVTLFPRNSLPHSIELTHSIDRTLHPPIQPLTRIHTPLHMLMKIIVISTPSPCYQLLMFFKRGGLGSQLRTVHSISLDIQHRYPQLLMFLFVFKEGALVAN